MGMRSLWPPIATCNRRKCIKKQGGFDEVQCARARPTCQLAPRGSPPPPPAAAAPPTPHPCEGPVFQVAKSHTVGMTALASTPQTANLGSTLAASARAGGTTPYKQHDQAGDVVTAARHQCQPVHRIRRRLGAVICSSRQQTPAQHQVVGPPPHHREHLHWGKPYPPLPLHCWPLEGVAALLAALPNLRASHGKLP